MRFSPVPGNFSLLLRWVEEFLHILSLILWRFLSAPQNFLSPTSRQRGIVLVFIPFRCPQILSNWFSQLDVFQLGNSRASFTQG
jgi:hypothetical protein